MSKLETTPGPWAVDDHEIGAVMSGNICVSRGKDAGRSLGEISANAHLIAAAPELYEALQDLFDAEYDDKPFTVELGQRCLAVLKKARGEQS